MDKVAAIIQARMGSTRLPGKVMKELCGESILSHVIKRVKKVKLIDEIIVATTKKDNIIAEEANKCNVNYFQGNEENVLKRYYYAAKENNIDTIVRITSDDPLIDYQIVDRVIEIYKQGDYTLVTNSAEQESERTFPLGLDTEVFSFQALEEAFQNHSKKHQKEHVTPYIYENYDNVYFYKNKYDYSNHRWTLDEEVDYKFIKKIYENLYNGNHEFLMRDIIAFLKDNPTIKKINKNVKQKTY